MNYCLCDADCNLQMKTKFIVRSPVRDSSPPSSVAAEANQTHFGTKTMAAAAKAGSAGLPEGSDIEELKAAFKQFDTDGSGSISATGMCVQ
jgi:hypothetical protein